MLYGKRTAIAPRTANATDISHNANLPKAPSYCYAIGNTVQSPINVDSAYLTSISPLRACFRHRPISSRRRFYGESKHPTMSKSRPLRSRFAYFRLQVSPKMAPEIDATDARTRRILLGAPAIRFTANFVICCLLLQVWE